MTTLQLYIIITNFRLGQREDLFCRRAKSLAQMRKLPRPINEMSSFECPGLYGYHCPSDPDFIYLHGQ